MIARLSRPSLRALPWPCRIGLISKDDVDAFDVLRKIRNDCAHKIFEFDLTKSPRIAVTAGCSKMPAGLPWSGGRLRPSCLDGLVRLKTS